MMHPDNAFKIIDSIEGTAALEEVPIIEAAGRVLPNPVFSTLASPPFSKAAMDGYALQKSDPSGSFAVLETIAAGDVPSRAVEKGTCSKIMTGAMVPEGADKIVRVEFTSEENGRMKVVTPEPYDNIIRKGENLAAGEPVLTPRILKPQDIGVLASMGIPSVEAAKPPLVGIITTGSELVNPGNPLKPGQIYNSNGYQICSQTARVNCPWKYYGVVEDNQDALSAVFSQAISECDFVLLSGGVSMGEFDFVPGIIRDGGAEILFHKLAIKPGKPTLFARKGSSCIFGLPGNPVSTFVIFEVLVKPSLLKWMGLSWKSEYFQAVLSESIIRRDGDRVEYRPVQVEGHSIVPFPYHGSAHLNALSRANGIIRIEQGILKLEKGTAVDVRPI